MDKYIGKLLDNRYEILEAVGVGGMATIYKARCRVLNRFVAIKILKDEFAQDEEFRRRFYIESQAVAKLSHPNIVAVYDVSHTEGLEYIVMELVEGVTLKEYLQKKERLSWQETLYFTQQIARALSHAHSRGIIHQDIKPQNVMITNEGAAKVTDFGIASFAANQETRVVQEAIGSVHYISPEQAKGSSVDYRTDIYSLGVVMYEMLTGKLPFEGETALSIVMQHINAMPLQPSEVVAGIPHGMDEIVMHAMCPAVARRYASADELFTDLQTLKADAGAEFDYNADAVRGDAPGLDETQALPHFQDVRHASGVQQSSQKGEYAPRPQSKKTAVREKRGLSSTTVAVITVVGFAVIAAVTALMLIFGGGSNVEKVPLPNFVNMNINDVVKFNDDGSFKNKSEFADFKFDLQPVLEAGQEDGLIFDQDPKDSKKVSVGATITLRYYKGSTDTGEYTLPAMKNQTKEWVTTAIERHNKENPDVYIDLTFQEEPSDSVDMNLVIRTEPGEGAKMGNGDKLTVIISTGPEKPLTAPDVRGLSLDVATNNLIALELKIKRGEEVESELKAGTVVDQSPAPDTEVKKGDTITVTVSSGKKPEAVTPPPDDDNVGEGGTAEPGTASLRVSIPEDARASAHIVVTLDDGSVGYEGTMTNTGEYVDITVKGSGDRSASVTVNGEDMGTQPLSFN